MDDVELQPYAIEAVKQHVPALRRHLEPPVLAKLLREGREWVVVLLPGLQHPENQLRFRTPKKYRDLFYRMPGVHASDRVNKMLQWDYEAWMQKEGVTHPVALFFPEP